MWDLGFNSAVFPLHPVRWLQSLSGARIITAGDFTTAGFVQSGTNLSKGLAVATAILAAHRNCGHKGPLLATAWTDGWDTSDATDRIVCREALDLALHEDIAVEVHGFCPSRCYHLYQGWKRQVRLRSDQDHVKIFRERDDVRELVAESVADFGQSMSGTMMPRGFIKRSDNPRA